MEAVLAFSDVTLKSKQNKKKNHTHNTGVALKVSEHQSGDKIH